MDETDYVKTGKEPSPQYWLARLTADDKYWKTAVENHFWLTQQRYGQQNTSAVSNLWKLMAKVKPEDVLLLAYENKIYAYGHAVECPYSSEQVSSIKKTVDANKHDYSQGVVCYSDSQVFYENLEKGCDNWGQRVSVDQWHCYMEDTKIYTFGVKDHITEGVATMSFFGVDAEYGKRKVKELENQYKNKNMFTSEVARLLLSKHNIILQGAPGTGKTYNTAAIALQVLDVTDVDLSDHDAVMKRYDELLNKQIYFTTFHQSLDYEDFVQGLKPRVISDANGNSSGVTYEPEDGIFKLACNAAQMDQSKDIVQCIDDFLQKIKGFENKREIPTVTGKSSLYVWWKEGNSTISSRSTISACQKGDEYSPSPLNIEKVKMQAIGEGVENNWQTYAQAFINAVKKEYLVTKNKPVVLIIDEINRGNVSKIFGELITLLESDKREKGAHPIKVTLPYTKESFSVPSNLYIIGTMNTTDRSTGTLDYALCRRFAFVTLKSDPHVIEHHYDKMNNSDLKGKVLKLFNEIKDFITLPKHLCGDLGIDDLMVGHSYFMAKGEEELKDKVRYEILPLIQEYINDGILNVDEKEKNEAFERWLKL